MLPVTITRQHLSISAQHRTAHALPLVNNGLARCPVRLAMACVLLCLVSLAGCSGPPLPALIPVKGTVTVDGKPVTSGQVSFFALVVDDTTKFAPPSGTIDSNGNYQSLPKTIPAPRSVNTR